MKVLLVDDDVDVLKSLESVLVHHGFEVSAVTNVPAALELVSTRPFDVLLSDLNVGQPGDGFTVVSAMRRVQPQACTFILTGYPDFESAITAIRNQVDDYFSKPLDPKQLVEAISAVQSGNRARARASVPGDVAGIIRHSERLICRRWIDEVLKDPEIGMLPLTYAERADHIPEVLQNLAAHLQGDTVELSAEAAEAARKHGRQRHQDGYTIPQIMYETRVLQDVVSSVIQQNLLNIDLSTLVPDILRVGQILQAELEVSIREYQAQVPRSLQTSFSILYKSPHLGVYMGDDTRVTDANDAFLRLIGRTREELVAGAIRWQEMTPEKYRAADEAALEQLREFGTSAPYEKEMTLPDGSCVPLLTGAVRIKSDPLEWSSYAVSLAEQRRAARIERTLRELKARSAVINQLAHEINNPLAALVFSVHLFGTHPALTSDMKSLLTDINQMLGRVAETVRRVLSESQKGTELSVDPQK